MIRTLNVSKNAPKLALALIMGLSSMTKASADAVKSEFRIGVVVSATGPASSLGAPERNAVELFDRVEREKPQRPFGVSVIVYDDASDPSKAVTLVRKLIEENQVHLIVCCTTTPNSMAVIETVNEARVPMISMASAAAIIEPANARPFTFKTPTSDRLALGRILTHMKSSGVRKVAFLGLDDSYGETGLKEFQSLTGLEGIELVRAERFARQDTNMTPQALKIRNSQVDAVYIHAIPPSANLAHEALKRVGYNGAIYHGPGVASQTFIDIGRSNVDGAFVAVGPVVVYDQLSAKNPVREVVAEFVDLYERAYGKGKVDMFSGQAWDAMRLALHAYEIQHATSITRPISVKEDVGRIRLEIKDALEMRTSGYKSINGVRTFSQVDHLGLDGSSILLTSVQDGKFRLVAE